MLNRIKELEQQFDDLEKQFDVLWTQREQKTDNLEKLQLGFKIVEIIQQQMELEERIKELKSQCKEEYSNYAYIKTVNEEVMEFATEDEANEYAEEHKKD